MKDTNTNRAGFKKTNAGWIPSDWGSLRLADLVQESRGIRYGIVQPGQYDPTGRFMIRGQDYSAGWADMSDFFRVSSSVEAPYRKARVQAGDLVMTIVGAGTGYVAEVPAWLDGANLTQTTARIAIDPKQAIPAFCKHVLLSSSGQIQVAKNIKGGAQPGLNCGDVENFVIQLPPLSVQKKIAEILCACDSAIELSSELIAAKRKRKNGLMQQLLLCGTNNTPRVRVHGFNRAWKHCCFGDVFERVVRKNTVGCENVLTISGARGLVSQKEYFSKRIAAEDHSGYYLLQNGEFAYNKSYSQGYPLGAIKRLNRYREGVVSTLYICFRIHANAADSDFAQHYFDSGVFNRELYMIAQEGARNHGLLNVTPDDFFASRLLLPPLDEQKSISEILNAAEAEIALLEQKRGALQQQKKGLMQKLLTGQIRVKP